MKFSRRRFFRLGQERGKTQWEDFCLRLQKSIQTELEVHDENEMGHGYAFMTLRQISDLSLIHVLCVEYQVAMVLQGTAKPDNIIGRSCLIISYDSSFNHIEEIANGAYVVQAGASAGYLLAQGFNQFSHVPSDYHLGQWLASPSCHDARTRYTFTSGLLRLHAFFADGQTAVVGNFGLADKLSLSTALLQKSIAHLFELKADASAQACFANSVWPSCYRLDALEPQQLEANLAQLFLGHQGTLCFPLEFVLFKLPQNYVQHHTHSKMDDVNLLYAAQEVNSEMKTRFDCAGLFLYEDEYMAT